MERQNYDSMRGCESSTDRSILAYFNLVREEQFLSWISCDRRYSFLITCGICQYLGHLTKEHNVGFQAPAWINILEKK